MTSVLFLPGLACDEELFAHQRVALGAWHAVQVVDVHTRADSLPAMARLLQAEHPGSHVLVGASMGAMVALQMALAAPERVQAVAVLGSTARPDTPELIRLRSQACELFAAGRMDEVLAANALMAFHPVNLSASVTHKALVARYLAMVRRAGAEQLIAQNRAVMAREDLRPRLPGLRCPVLVMCGEADQLTPPAVAREIADALPAATLELVPGAGHMLTMEQPEIVSAALLRWLRTINV
jgi:pimeloyl-ACP methyl ester carboxylesterase